MSNELARRFDALMARLDQWLGPQAQPADWSAVAHRWQRNGRTGQLRAVAPELLSDIQLEDVLGLERQKSTLVKNTEQFVAGLPANNALLWGARGTGKSSLIKALLNRYHAQGLRLIEVDVTALMDLPEVVAPLLGRPERFVLYVDDLSFSEGDDGYRALKAALDGSIAAPPENVLIYASSNRRHLLPEYTSENAQSALVDGELHHGEAVEEKVSLSERFGVWLAFHPFNQQQYLAITAHWLQHYGVSMDEVCRRHALAWALRRGSRSGRVAAQFARDWAGQQSLEKHTGA